MKPRDSVARNPRELEFDLRGLQLGFRLSDQGREKLALSPAIDPDIEAYAQWLEDKITREAENVGFLEGRGHSPYKS